LKGLNGMGDISTKSISCFGNPRGQGGIRKIFYETNFPPRLRRNFAKNPLFLVDYSGVAQNMGRLPTETALNGNGCRVPAVESYENRSILALVCGAEQKGRIAFLAASEPRGRGNTEARKEKGIPHEISRSEVVGCTITGCIVGTRNST
jgi:hypothetical protein